MADTSETQVEGGRGGCVATDELKVEMLGQSGGQTKKLVVQMHFPFVDHKSKLLCTTSMASRSKWIFGVLDRQPCVYLFN